MNTSMRSRAKAAIAVVATAVAVAALAVVAPQAAVAGPQTVSQTFSYTGSTQTFTVPSGISALTVTLRGGEGGNGGADATPAPDPGGYRGLVTGTIAVTPGQVLTVGVGGGGQTGVSQKNAGNASAAIGGSNPIGGYAGGVGGKAGSNGSSGFGGAGGAASVIRIGSTDIVAGGGGGNGGSGQYAPTRGRQATSTYTGRADATATSGQNGTDANVICAQTSCSNNDGGGGGAGGGGAQGGAAGAVEFGAGTSNEWFGYGGSVGQNSIASFSGLSATYESYAGENSQNGSIVISYTTGSPAAPSAVSGVAGDASVALAWTAPTDPGQSAITGYVARSSSDNGTTWSSSVDLGTTATSGTVSGLVNGTGYVFEIAAVNAVGTGVWSTPSATITPQGPPTAPVISGIAARDGALSLTLTAPTGGAAVTGYDYRLDGGAWTTVASTSTTLVVPGLVNGTRYQVEVRAESAVGAGAVSDPASGTPQAVPGAPTISSIAAGAGSITLSFTTGFDGGAAITGYEYRLNGTGSWIAATGTTSPLVISGLADDTAYSVELRADNASGSGPASAAASVRTPALPGAPLVSSVTAGDGSAVVAFTAGSTGGLPIDHYEVQTVADGPWTAAGSASPIVLDGLSNGTTYAVSVRAVSSVGAGPASTAIAVTPATTPGAPSIVGDTVAGSDATLSAAFTAPASDGGAAITGYQYSTDGGATWRDRADGGGSASPVVITALSDTGAALVNGTTYYVELRAVNAVGVGTASAVARGIARTVPSAPSISQVVPGPSSLTVTFTPGANGGSEITDYRYSLDGGITWTSTGTLGSTFAIGGLRNGTAYAVQVEAINGVGEGSASAFAHGTPVAAPGRASIDSVVRSNQTLTASVSLADDGGSPVTAWQYSTDGGATWATASGTTSPLVLTVLSADGTTRLQNGTGYSLLVRAVTAVGTGPASAATTVAPASAPAAPAIALTPGDGAVVVAFTLGADGGSPVGGLDYSIDAGAHWTSAGTLSSPLTITGLRNGTAYAIQLRADNAIGEGAASVTASTTPRTVPGAPTGVTAGSNSASADVAWSAPADDGGAAITGYTAAAYATSTSTTPVRTCTTTGTSCSITGLTNQTGYYVAVSATNAAGTGAASAPRVLVTPLARPSAPSTPTLTAGDGTLSAAFTAGSIGDGTLVAYQYSLDGGTTWVTAGTSSPISITGLTDGTSYSVLIRAVSTAGAGAASAAASATPYGYPSAPDPTRIVANAGDRQVAISWAAPSLNGGVLGDYTATAFSAQSSGSTVGTCTTTTLSCTISGLSNGTTYWISLQTRNSVSMYSPRSDPRVPATPSVTPGAPTAVQATAGDRRASVTWTAPTSTGASAISGYTVLCSTGGAYSACPGATVTGTTAQVTGLTNGTAYTFEVTATNGSGTGPASAASASVTPLAAGTVPTFGTPTATVDGYTVAIANYDANVSYALTASAGTPSRSGATITVTGVAASGASTVTVTATRSGYTTTSATVSGAALNAGVAPTFSGMTANPDGFSFTIGNYDAGSSYAITADGGASVSHDGAVVTVSGLSLGGTSRVQVTVSKAGSADASASIDGAAMTVGTPPTLGAPTSTATGFRFAIEDYDAALTYTATATGGASVVISGDTVTVTGLTDGAGADVTVVAVKPHVSSASAVQHGAALLAGATPTVSAATSTVDGFTFTVDIVDGPDYGVTTTAGSVSLSGGTVVVTGLQPGQSADVTVTAVQSGHVTVSTTVTATALLTGIVPLFAAPDRTPDGFTVAIQNLDALGRYAVSTSSGTATLADGVITVTGLDPAEGATVTVTVSHDGYTDGVSTVSGTALDAGTAPTLADVVATTDGFTFTIANYDGSLQYAFDATPHATVTIDGSGHGVLSGVAGGTAVTLTVRATRPGVSTAVATTGATTLLPTDAPQLSAATPLAGGYSFEITDYDPDLTYTFVQADGGSVVRSGSTVTVSGLGAAVTSSTTVSATSPGHAVAVASVSGTSFPSGPTPVVGAVTRTLDGFTFTFTADPAATYSVTSDAGSVTISGTTVTVTGLAPGATTTVHLTASVPGSLDAVSDVAGTAIALGVAPVLGAPTSGSGGFVVRITNYSALWGYRLATTAGSATRDGDRVTVSGLADGASATVTVTAIRGGYRDASASQTGSATAAVVVRTPPRSGSVPTPPTSGSTSSAAGPGSGSAGAPATNGPTTPAFGESRPGSGTVHTGGADVPATLTPGVNDIVLSSTDGRLTLSVAAWSHGAAQPLGAHGVIEVLRGGTTRVVVSGFAPDSEIVVWGMSHLRQIATTRTDHQGRLTQLVRLPWSMVPGSHTLIVSGTDDSGAPITMQVGIRVLPVAHPATAPGGFAWWWLVIAAAGVLLVLIGWFVIRRRRRQREA